MSSNVKITLNQLFIRIAAIGVVALLLTGSVLIYQEQQKAIKQWQADAIARSTSVTASYYSSLVSKLVLGQDKKIKKILSDLKEQEELSSINVIPANRLDPQIIETCNVDYNRAYFLQVPTCHKITGQRLAIYHELRSIGHSIGYLAKEIKIPRYTPWHKTYFVAHVAVVLMVFLAMLFFMLRDIKKHLIRPLKNIGERLDHQNGFTGQSIDMDVQELQSIFDSLKKSIATTIEFEQKAQRYEYEAKIGQVAQQVAHDIKSPLAALSVLQQDLQELPEEKRLLLRSAVQRIHDIANDLSKKKNLTDVQNASDHPSQQGHEELSVQLLSSLIDTLVSEKRLQFRSKINVEIEASLGQESYGLFARIQTREFKRMLSNLINNAIEAMGDNGNKVGLTLKPDETDKIRITISDNGKGIPPEILPKLMQRGETHGKSGGTGLGLYHARMTVQSWGGDVCLESEVGKGTTVTISLLQEPAPAWFVPELKIENGSTVVIVDDDNSIHQIWRGRLEKFVKGNNVTVKHFSTPDELVATNVSKEKRLLVLCDCEFLGHSKTGLDVIEDLGLSSNSVLVTSHFEEPKIRERCQKLGVRLIPKNLAGFVPVHAGRFTVDGGRLAQFDSPLVTDVSGILSDKIVSKLNPDDITPASTVQRIPSTDTSVTYGELSPSSNPHAILIDDDKLVHMNWKISAKKNGKILRTFSDPTGFQNVMADIEKSTPIYVDSNLANGIKGEDVACELKAMGFSNLYLATGFDKSNFPDMPWIKDVVGKSPPW